MACVPYRRNVQLDLDSTRLVAALAVRPEDLQHNSRDDVSVKEIMSGCGAQVGILQTHPLSCTTFRDLEMTVYYEARISKGVTSRPPGIIDEAYAKNPFHFHANAAVLVFRIALVE